MLYHPTVLEISPLSLSLKGKLAKRSGARDINLGNLTFINTYSLF